MRRSLLRLGLAVPLLVAACGSSSPGGSGAGSPGTGGASPGTGGPVASAGASQGQPSVIPVIVSSRQVVGSNRFVFSFLDPATNLPAATPDRPASVAFIAPGETQPGTATPATFIWAIEGQRGDYVATVSFPVAGAWKAVFLTKAPGAGEQEAIGVDFDVVDSTPTVQVGAAAPASDNPTIASAGAVNRVSTDTKPDPAFYQLTVKEALAAHRPFVLAFATPAFCQSAQCGPTLDRVKAAAATAPSSVAFINVEPYRLAYTEGRLQPVLDENGQLQPVPAVDQWGILTEPWIFAVDGDGIVRASFEGVVSDDELRAAIAEIAKA